MLVLSPSLTLVLSLFQRRLSATDTEDKMLNIYNDLVPKGAQMGGRIFDCQ